MMVACHFRLPKNCGWIKQNNYFKNDLTSLSPSFSYFILWYCANWYCRTENLFFTIELWKCNHSAWVFHSYFNSSGLTSFQSRHHHEQISKNDYQHHCSLFEFLFLNRKTISSELCAIIYDLTVRKQFCMLHTVCNLPLETFLSIHQQHRVFIACSCQLSFYWETYLSKN